MARDQQPFSEVLFEFRRIGANVRVAAIDPRTNIEVVVVGSATMSEELLKEMARRKLIYALRRSQA